MTKVLLLQSDILKYRVPVFSKLAEKYDLTVVYTRKDQSPSDVPYKRIHLDEIKIGSLIWVKGCLSLCKSFDVVIFMLNMHYVNYSLIPFLPYHYKTISYGIGIRASYKRQFNLCRSHTILDDCLAKIQFSSDATLVYFKEVLDFYSISDAVKQRCFETRNTVDILSIEMGKMDKDTILFIGTLYKEKKVEVLISAYKEAFLQAQTNDFPKMVIVGGGSEYDRLVAMVKESHMEDRIVFMGPLYDESIIAGLYNSSIACISPNQAGLSVPHSMGYGVPFITTKDAITGGEILHINNNENGVLMNSLSELPSIISDIHKNKEKYIEYGKRAYTYYHSKANIDIMVKGFENAIEYVLNE